MHAADPEGSFVRTQSKPLEKKGFLRRNPCARDTRVVHLSSVAFEQSP